MIQFVSQGLGHAPPVTLTSSGSVLPVPENGNLLSQRLLWLPVVMTNLLWVPYSHVFVLEGYYDKFVMFMVCYCNPTYLPTKFRFGHPLLLKYKNPHLICV